MTDTTLDKFVADDHDLQPSSKYILQRIEEHGAQTVDELVDAGPFERKTIYNAASRLRQMNLLESQRTAETSDIRECEYVFP